MAVYLHRHRNMTVDAALEFIRSKRPQIHLNSRQLSAVYLAANEGKKGS